LLGIFRKGDESYAQLQQTVRAGVQDKLALNDELSPRPIYLESSHLRFRYRSDLELPFQIRPNPNLKFRNANQYLISEFKSSYSAGLEEEPPRIAIIGSGIVGTATAFSLIRNTRYALRMHDVVASQLTRAKVVLNGDVAYTSDLKAALDGATYAIICVPTPESSTKSSEAYDYSMLDAACAKVAQLARGNCTIIIRSTIDPLKAREIANSFGRVWFVPEFLREQSYLQDAVKPERILIGVPNPNSVSERIAAMRFFEAFACPKYVVSLEEAALAKLATNSFLATKISFFNEVGELARATNNVDPEMLSELIALDPRIGRYGIKAGRSFGGKCLPKDTKALLKLSGSRVLAAAIEVNDQITERKLAPKVRIGTSR
jgi:nucleotide sugar dehydrogenase